MLDSPPPDRLGKWCGGVLIWVAAMTPLLAYLGPLGFALLPAIAGLLMLPAARIGRRDRPLAALLLAGLAWAWGSMLWSPMRPGELEDNVAAKLTAMAPLFWIAWRGARRADPRLARIALRVLGVGLAVFGVVLAIEAATQAAIYRTLHEALYEPIRPDIALRNLGRSTFVLALLWPVAALGAARAGAPRWLLVPMVAGMAYAAVVFGSDAPFLSVAVAAAAGVIVWRAPDRGPRALGWAAAGFFLFMPALVMAGRASGLYTPVQAGLEPSWALRMDFWANTVDLIGQQRLRGWGLDASRTFTDAVRLHPHDGALQMWLELGFPGAVLAAAFWGLTFRRLARSGPRGEGWAPPAACASAAVYLLFGAVNFGLWQEWWLALGALVAMFAALLRTQPVARFERTARQTSTEDPILL